MNVNDRILRIVWCRYNETHYNERNIFGNTSERERYVNRYCQIVMSFMLPNHLFVFMFNLAEKLYETETYKHCKIKTFKRNVRRVVGRIGGWTTRTFLEVVNRSQKSKTDDQDKTNILRQHQKPVNFFRMKFNFYKIHWQCIMPATMNV